MSFDKLVERLKECKEIEEVKELVGNHVDMYFTSYYKYTFNFSGKIEIDGYPDIEFSIGWGGDSDQIYRQEVCAGYNGTLSDFSPSSLLVKIDNDVILDLWEY